MYTNYMIFLPVRTIFHSKEKSINFILEKNSFKRNYCKLIVLIWKDFEYKLI